MGEPGVGKSRLCYEFKLQAEREGLVLETFSVSHGRAYPYLPLIELLNTYFQLTPQDDDRRRRERVTGKVLTLDRHLEDTLPFLCALVGVEEATASLAHLDPPLRRRHTFEAITRLLLRETSISPCSCWWKTCTGWTARRRPGCSSSATGSPRRASSCW